MIGEAAGTANVTLTKGDAVGPSRIASSSFVNGCLGITRVRSGRRSKMTIGKPIAAIHFGSVNDPPRLQK